MRRYPVILIMLAVCLAGAPLAHAQLVVNTSQAGAPSWARAVAPGLLATRQSLINLPFRMLPPPKDFGQPVEVQLFVSTDRAASWKFYDRRRPFDATFTFQAPADGEYWFVTQIVNQQRQSYPAYNGPEARFVVDTKPPRLQLSANKGADGLVVAQWNVEDEYLAKDTLLIEWRAGLGDAWRRVVVSAGGERLSADAISGQTQWRPPQQVAQVFVRARVQDIAGNIAELNRTAVLTNNIPLANSGQSPVDPFAGRREEKPLATRRDASKATGAGMGSVAWPDNETRYLAEQDDQRRSAAHRSGALATVPPPSPERQGASDPPHSTASNLQNTSHRLNDFSSLNPTPNATPQAAAGNTMTSQQPPNDLLPPGEQPRVTKSRRLHLEYDIASVAADGVAKVELWQTRDNGRTWRPWGLDPDCESPMLVALENDGVHGFRIVITAVNGLAGAAPQPGEPADLWVDVDSEAPVARITTAKYGRDALAGNLLIQWDASDLKLTERPISLYYRAADRQRWTPIVKGASHSGEFTWAVGAHVPKQVYLRLEVRDKAGNVGVHELTEPVSLEGLIPKGLIRGVRPVADIHFETSRRRFLR